jgi:hypothetical protein
MFPQDSSGVVSIRIHSMDISSQQWCIRLIALSLLILKVEVYCSLLFEVWRSLLIGVPFFLAIQNNRDTNKNIFSKETLKFYPSYLWNLPFFKRLLEILFCTLMEF